MKRLIFTLIIGFAFIAPFGNANAQGKTKIGHINATELLQMMPGRDSAKKQLEKFYNELQEQLLDMKNEYDKKVTEFQSINPDSITEYLYQYKVKEIQELEQKIQKFQMDAQELLQSKEETLLKPLLDRAQDAIKKVADENAFSYVLDISTGTVLFHGNGIDIMPLVKKELGLE